jgi:5-methylcytosine-specific restriction enzyme subunit McrC
MAAEVVRLREYEYLSYDHIGAEDVDALERLVERLGVPIFRFYRNRLQARHYVGVLTAGNRSYQLLPKIYERDESNLTLLLILLRHTRRLSIRPAGITQLAKSNGSFLEIWIHHFAETLNHALRRNPRRAYVDIEEEVGLLRGRLLIEQMRMGRDRLRAKYPCRYQVFTGDHLLNQVLAYCNRLLLSLTSVSSTLRVIRENEALLGEARQRSVSVEDVDRIHLNRLNKDYEPLLQLCRLLLAHSTLDLRSGRIQQLALVFDMNRLFEDFVRTFVERFASQLGFAEAGSLRRVRAQHVLGKLFGLFSMEVDLVLTDSEGRRVLVDTKYKATDPKDKRGGLAQSDFYQMYAYARAGLQAYDDVVLLFPHTGGLHRTFTADQIRLHVRELDLRRFVDLEAGNLHIPKALEAFRHALSVRTTNELR